jgi:hypothetical protein
MLTRHVYSELINLTSALHHHYDDAGIKTKGLIMGWLMPNALLFSEGREQNDSAAFASPWLRLKSHFACSFSFNCSPAPEGN